MLIADEHKGKRIYRCTETGRTAISVTTCAADVASPDEDEFAGVPAPLLKMHGEEGTGCHHAALDWLAFTHQMIPHFTVPPKPPHHPDERRWRNVIANAVAGMQQFCEDYAVTPVAIERPSVCWRYGIAGTPDLLADLAFRSKRVRAIVELKFVASLTTAHRVQVRLYRKLEGYDDARMGLLVNISRTDGSVKVRPVYWEAEPELDAKALCCAGRLR